MLTNHAAARLHAARQATARRIAWWRTDFATTWNGFPPGDRQAYAGGWLVALAVFAGAAAFHWWSLVAFSAVLAAWATVAYAMVRRAVLTNLATQQAMIDHPTGAPRLMDTECHGCGEHMRRLYDGTGWRPAEIRSASGPHRTI